MSDLLAARLQMAISLGFHIVFASIGIAMPFLMATSHYKWLKTGNKAYYVLTKSWSRGVAIFFATGAVSGTVLSFELGLLWPEFMLHAGALIGLPFSWEGTAFFVEAIALGLFLYGWNRLKPWVHWWCGAVVGLSGTASAFFVIAANGWMNSPSGFDLIDGRFENIDPVAAMFNDAFFLQAVHMVFAAFCATGFAVAGLHAFLLLRGGNKEIHLPALKIAMGWAAVFTLLQPLSGDILAKDVAVRQPLKLAAAEALFETQSNAPLIIGGIPSVAERRVDYAVELPGLLSFLAHGDFQAEVLGLNEFPEDEWPPVLIVHLAFQIMVAIGTILAVSSLLFLGAIRFRPSLIRAPWFLYKLVALAPLGFIAIEAGWTVTEVGRQPWIIYGIMKTADAVTSVPGIWVSCVLFTLLYLLLTAILVWLMRRQIVALEQGKIT